MVDVSKFTYDTPVLIKIMRPSGVYVPELKTYTPLEAYTSVSNVISILNRGMDITFPKESKNHEISKTIEDMILYYKQKEMEANEKTGYVGTDVSKALETIQDINDSRIPAQELKKEAETHVFDYRDISVRIAKNLSNNTFNQVFNSEEFNHGKDMFKEAARERRSRDRIDKRKAIIRANYIEDAVTMLRYMHDPALDEIEKDQIGDMEFLNPNTAPHSSKDTKKKKNI